MATRANLVLATTAVAACLALFPGYFYQSLVIASIVGTGILYAINLVSFLSYRRYRDDVTSTFRVPGGYAASVLGFVALATTMVGLGATEVVWSVMALGLLSSYCVVQSMFLDGPTVMETTA